MSWKRLEPPKQEDEGITMSKLLRTSIVALALVAGASSAMAAYDQVPDNNDQYGGYAPNSQEGARAFWDRQSDK